MDKSGNGKVERGRRIGFVDVCFFQQIPQRSKQGVFFIAPQGKQNKNWEKRCGFLHEALQHSTLHLSGGWMGWRISIFSAIFMFGISIIFRTDRSHFSFASVFVHKVVGMDLHLFATELPSHFCTVRYP